MNFLPPARTARLGFVISYEGDLRDTHVLSLREIVKLQGVERTGERRGTP
jgi:hypothetical protein